MASLLLASVVGDGCGEISRVGAGLGEGVDNSSVSPESPESRGSGLGRPPPPVIAGGLEASGGLIGAGISVRPGRTGLIGRDAGGILPGRGCISGGLGIITG